MTHKEFLSRVRYEAEVYGWDSYFVWNSRHSPAGWPDLVLIRPPEIIFAELKVGRDRLTVHQEMCLESLRECKQEVHVWRPEDSEAILKRLSRT